MVSDSALKITSAFLSVSDKSGLDDFCKVLANFNVKLRATSGTAKALESKGLRADPIERLTRYPEMLSGRVKTLQPEIFSAILAKKEPGHLQQLKRYGIEPVDMVVCNFYPFQEMSQKNDITNEELMEEIDIGGPSMVRAAAKNFRYLTVVPSPRSYGKVAEEIKRSNGFVSFETRKELALQAFEIVASYDVSIYNTLSQRFRGPVLFPHHFLISASEYERPKYGENPDQGAMIYSIDGFNTMGNWEQIFGDTRSYNNYLDVGSSYEIIEGFENNPAAATVKHGEISGFAFASSLSEAYALAHACDPQADFGCTTVFNRVVDLDTAKLVGKNERSDDGSVYTEIVVAPGYDPDALEILKRKQKKKMRLIVKKTDANYPYEVKVTQGLVLVQRRVNYSQKLGRNEVDVVSKKKPSYEEMEKLLGLWEVVRKVRSNGVVVGDGEYQNESLIKLWTYGVGSFRKRNGAVKTALDNAGERAKNAFAASDGFFPFRDSIDLLGRAGIAGVIQPGGSVSDKAVVEAANEYGMGMVITHRRAFKH